MSNEVEIAQTGAPVEPQASAVAEAPKVEGSESTTEQVETQQQEQPRDEKGRYVPQERVNEITRARREAERERDFLRQQLETFQRQTPPPVTQSEGPPRFEEFNDLNEWSAATARYFKETSASEAVRLAQQQLYEQQMYARQADIATQFESRANAYAAENPGFDERFTAFTQMFRPTAEIAEAIALSDQGPAVFDYLAQHLDEADRILRMPPHMAALQIGRIEERLSRPKQAPVTKAPTPAPALGGGSRPSELGDKTPIGEWMARRNARS